MIHRHLLIINNINTFLILFRWINDTNSIYCLNEVNIVNIIFININWTIIIEYRIINMDNIMITLIV